jgi:Phosphatase
VSHKARNRPPRLETRPPDVHRAPPATPAELLERAKVAGTGAAPGRTELRSYVERLVAGDRLALGEVAPMHGLTMVDGWVAMKAVFGATYEAPTIEPSRTLQFAQAAATRVRDVARSRARVAFATAAPASLLSVYFALARIAASAGAEVEELADVGPIRADGRHPRWLRSVDGVVTVTDGRALCDTRDGEAAREWLFVLSRPRLVVADGPFAEVAWESGIEVVTFAGLDHCALAIPAARAERCTLVPMRIDRPPGAYRSVVSAFGPPEADHPVGQAPYGM